MNTLTLGYIVLATLISGVMCVFLAATVSLTVLSRWANRLSAYSVGVLLAAALLHLLPETVEELSPHTAGMVMLIGLAAFFLLEKVALGLLGHNHTPDHPGQASGVMVLVGDAVHNFVDGVLIAAAFMQDTALGISTAVAVIAHEVPQEISDFMLLLSSGYSRKRALLLNSLSALTSVVGGVLAWTALQGVSHAVPYALGIAAASFLYIAIADVVPMLQQQRKPADYLSQPLLVLIGVFSIVLFSAHHHH